MPYIEPEEPEEGTGVRIIDLHICFGGVSRTSHRRCILCVTFVVRKYCDDCDNS